MLIRIVRTEKKMRFDQVRKLIYDYPDDTIFNKGLEKFLPKGITRIKEDQSLVVTINHNLDVDPISILIYEKNSDSAPMHGRAIDRNKVEVIIPDYRKQYEIVLIG